MNNNNINLFSTFFPLNFGNTNKSIIQNNYSHTYILKDKFNKTKINKITNEDGLSFSFVNSGKFQNKNHMSFSLFSLTKNRKSPTLNNKIPLIQANHNFDLNQNINKNLSSQNIKHNNKIKLNFNKKIYDFNNKNNIVFNKNRNYFSKDSINLLKYLNFKNLFEKNKNSKDIFSCRSIKKLNYSDNKKDNTIRNNNTDNSGELNNYLTVYNFKSYNISQNSIPKGESKVTNLIKKDIIGLPKMIIKYPKNNDNNINLNTLYAKEKENNNQIKTFFPSKSMNELFISKNIFNKTKIIKKHFLMKNVKNNKKIMIDSLSIPGYTHNREKINQDTYMILPNNIATENNLSELSNLYVFGVFDGHGEFGDIISKEVKNYFIEYFNKLNYDSNENYDKLSSNNYKEIYSLFNKIDKKLHQKYSSKNICYNSGTTANIILLFKNKIISINIGDSKSILISGKNNNIIQLNTCHNPEVEEEKKRIEKNGGEVGRVNWADFGPHRVWYKGRIYPGLSISRSFGDFISEPLGVFSVPEIKEYDIDYKKAKFMVMATDGIWEFLSNDKVRDIIMPYYDEKNINGGINKLIDIASKIWNVKNPNYIDDLSVILLFFK